MDFDGGIHTPDKAVCLAWQQMAYYIWRKASVVLAASPALWAKQTPARSWDQGVSVIACGVQTWRHISQAMQIWDEKNEPIAGFVCF
ncbi:MAG: hypothetical protein M5U34_35795 [Chloroflexi bacterium]|nr:hypothetical protein [Chloroflexota bacterium]